MSLFWKRKVEIKLGPSSAPGENSASLRDDHLLAVFSHGPALLTSSNLDYLPSASSPITLGRGGGSTYESRGTHSVYSTQFRDSSPGPSDPHLQVYAPRTVRGSGTVSAGIRHRLCPLHVLTVRWTQSRRQDSDWVRTEVEVSTGCWRVKGALSPPR